MFKSLKNFKREKQKNDVGAIPDFSQDNFSNSINTMTYSERRSFIDKKYKELILENKIEKAKEEDNQDEISNAATDEKQKNTSIKSETDLSLADKKSVVESKKGGLHEECFSKSETSVEDDGIPGAFVDRTTGEYISAENLNSVPRHIIEDIRNRENSNLQNKLAEKDAEIASLKAKLLQKKEKGNLYNSEVPGTSALPDVNVDFNSNNLSESDLDSFLSEEDPCNEIYKDNIQDNNQETFQSATDLADLDSEDKKVLNEQKQIIHQNILKIMGK